MAVEISFPVRYVEVDAQRVVYYAHYLAWYELGQEALLAALGRPPEEAHPPVLEATCRYRAPVRYGETVTVRSRPLEEEQGHLWIAHTVLVGPEVRAEGATLLGGAGDLAAGSPATGSIERLPAAAALPLRGRVGEFPLRVRYAETDSSGGAHFSRYLVWFEVGRIAYLHHIGLHYAEMETESSPFVIAWAGCRYLSPVHFDEALSIRVWPLEVRQRSFALGYHIVHQDGRPVALGRTVQTFIGPTGRPAPIPERARGLLLAALDED